MSAVCSRLVSVIALTLMLGQASKCQQTLKAAFVVPQQRPIDGKLFDAIRDGNVSQVQKLLASGADPNANEANGWRPLLVLGGTPTQEYQIARMLIAKGANVNYRQPDQGWTPLMTVLHSRGASVLLVKLLLSKGADPKVPEVDGTTTLHLAVRTGNILIVKELLARGIPLSVRTKAIPISHLNEIGEDNSLQEERDHSLEPNFEEGGRTPAFELVSNFNLEMAEFLFLERADFKSIDANGWTILHWAIKSGDRNSINWLLKNGLDPNAPSNGGYRPLHVAMRAGFGFPDPDTIRILLKAGANPSIRNNSGQTPLDLLRSDVAWRLRPTLPQTANDTQFADRYLEFANKAAKMLDGDAPAIVRPNPVVDSLGTRYEALNFSLCRAERAVRILDGKVVLRLMFQPPKRSIRITLQDVMLNGYETVKQGPFQISIQKGQSATFEIEFPLTASSAGGVDAGYNIVYLGDNSMSASGQFSEGPQIQPVFVTKSGPESVVCLRNNISNRTMLVRFDKVTQNGKSLSKYTGKVFRVESGQTLATGIPGHSGKQPIEVSFSTNLTPNRRWTHGNVALVP